MTESKYWEDHRRDLTEPEHAEAFNEMDDEPMYSLAVPGATAEQREQIFTAAYDAAAGLAEKMGLDVIGVGRLDRLEEPEADIEEVPASIVDLAVDVLTARWNLHRGEARLMVEDIERNGLLRAERGWPCHAASAQVEQAAQVSITPP